LYNILEDEFRVRPPRLLDWWIDSGEGEDRQEFIHRLFVHFCEDDFRRLRKYNQALSSPPDRWLQRVANNRIKDDLKRKRIPIVYMDDLGRLSAPAATNLSKVIEDNEAARTIDRCMQRLSEYERLLVQCRAEERAPGETAIMAGKVDNPRNRKRIADATGYATEKLVRIVRRENRELYDQLVAPPNRGDRRRISGGKRRRDRRA
jgi:hypothetical protein